VKVIQSLDQKRKKFKIAHFNESMKIRSVSLSDIPALTGLYLKIWEDEFTDPRELKKYFLKKVKNKEGFVAVEDNKLVGFIGFSKEYFRIVCSRKRSFKDSDYLDWVFVHKDYRGKGIAEELIKKFEKNAKKRRVRRIYSTTIPKNKAAIKMHKKLGFSQAGYVWNLWEEGDKELFFSKKVGGR
jgi:GNAT superfamily N-acetyltransferase